jgi:hypothetical protein
MKSNGPRCSWDKPTFFSASLRVTFLGFFLVT